MGRGKAFQSLGANTMKALSPYEVFERGISSMDASEVERRPGLELRWVIRLHK